jgi:hypothetical protein
MTSYLDQKQAAQKTKVQLDKDEEFKNTEMGRDDGIQTLAHSVHHWYRSQHKTNTKRPAQNVRLEIQNRRPTRRCEVRCGGEKQEGGESTRLVMKSIK